MKYTTNKNIRILFTKNIRQQKSIANYVIIFALTEMELIKINYRKLVDIYDVDELSTEAGPFELITLRCNFSLSHGYKSE